MTHFNGAHPDHPGSSAQAGGTPRAQSHTPINVHDVIGNNTWEKSNKVPSNNRLGNDIQSSHANTVSPSPALSSTRDNNAQRHQNQRPTAPSRNDFAGEPGVLLDGPSVSTLNVLLVGSDAFCSRLTQRFSQARLVVKTSCTRDYLMALGQSSHITPDIIIGQIEGLDAQRHAIITGFRRLAPGVKLIVIAEPEKESFAIKAVESGFDEYLLEPVEASALTSLLLQESRPVQAEKFDARLPNDDTLTAAQGHAGLDRATEKTGRHQGAQVVMPAGEARRQGGRDDAFHSDWLSDDIDMTSSSAEPTAFASHRQKTGEKQGITTGESAAGGVTSQQTQPAIQSLSRDANQSGNQPGSHNHANAAATNAAAAHHAGGMYGDDPYDTADAELGDIDLVDCLLSEPAKFEALVLKLVAGRSGVTDVGFSANASEVPADHAGAWVTFRGKRLGVLHAPPPAAKTQLAPWASWIAHWLAMKQQMTSLWNMANKDELTGAWNRRFFDRHLARVIAQATQKRFPVTVLVFDIDNFKTYNDRYGHPAGDEILRETVRLMNSVVREHDIVARIGGDEFAVIFWDPHGPRKPNSSHPDDVRDAARRFQQAICSHHFPKLLEEAPGTLTISGGLASYPWDGVTAQALVERADTMLLHSKTQGKNAITFGAGAARGGDPFEHDA